MSTSSNIIAVEEIRHFFSCSPAQAIEIHEYAKGVINDDQFKHGSWDLMYEYFLNSGEMPYGVAKARDGDPYEWVGDRVERLFGDQ